MKLNDLKGLLGCEIVLYRIPENESVYQKVGADLNQEYKFYNYGNCEVAEIDSRDKNSISIYLK